MSPNHLLVCAACGQPECWDGELMCDDAMRAGTARCTCRWDETGRDWTGPLEVDPSCEAHGEPS